MRYKVLKGSDSYLALLLLKAKMNAANQAAKDIVKELGAERYTYASGLDVIAGGISGIEYAHRPDGWALAFPREFSNVYYPVRNLIRNKEIIDKLKNLPVVKADELNNILGYKSQNIENGRRFIMAYYPGILFREGFILIKVHESANYCPANADIIEITVSEYKELEASDDTVKCTPAKSRQ